MTSLLDFRCLLGWCHQSMTTTVGTLASNHHLIEDLAVLIGSCLYSVPNKGLDSSLLGKGGRMKRDFVVLSKC